MIDYKIIHDSVTHYEAHGYRRIETPWVVPESVSEITRPLADGKDWTIEHNKMVLVSSGEQSFLQLSLLGQLPAGKYQTITPCWRHDPVDFLHREYFMKNELINTEMVDIFTLDDMVNQAMAFFSTYLDDVRQIKTEEGTDIVWNGNELGSYGIRSCRWLKWVYGTGVAEPRLSSLIKLSGVKK